MFEILTYFTIGLIVLVVPTFLSICLGRYMMRQSPGGLDDSFMEQFLLPAIFGGGLVLSVIAAFFFVAMVGQACLHSLVNLP